MSRLPLLYILSNGRSGSTLLDLLLHAQPQIWSVGEAQILPWELRAERAPCGCGAELRACPFWSPILPRIPLAGAVPPIEHFREAHGRGRVLRWEHLNDLLRGRVGARRADAAREYGAHNRRYLEAVKDAAEELRGHPVEWLVDASKDPYRLLWLESSGLFDVRVVHLVKDPRAFVHSMTRADQKRGRRSLRFAARWVVENALFRRLCERGFAADRKLRLRYEDLTRAPERTLETLGAWLGTRLDARFGDGFRAVENHCVAGNRMRWRADGIRFDESWRESLPKELARAVWTLTWPLRGAMGYVQP